MTNLDALLLRGSSGDLETGLNELRYTILTKGIPANNDGMSDLRIYIWLILLNVPAMKTESYLDLVRQGASPAYTKIRNDTFRTLATDPLFRRRVTENSLTRVLNAVAWKIHDAHESKINGWQSPPSLSEFGGGSPEDRSFSTRFTDASSSKATEDTSQVGYVQGMNVLAAPFLYAARSESEAYAAFEKLITHECPGYVRGSMDGVHRGLRLVDSVLELVDKRLYEYLGSKQLHAEIYAFPSVLTMSACTPPLPEVLQLWDFIFAYGPHLNILCVVAQLVLIREELLLSPNPNSLLRSMPSLNARATINLATSFMSKIPDDIYRQIIAHAK